jgi:hypothetical protein
VGEASAAVNMAKSKLLWLVAGMSLAAFGTTRARFVPRG